MEAHAQWRVRSEHQVTLMLIFSYTAFQLAEVAAMSGIVASLTAGFLGKRLMTRALHDDSAREFAAQFFQLLAALSESLIFLLLGINIALFTHDFNLAFTGASLPATRTGSRSAQQHRKSEIENSTPPAASSLKLGCVAASTVVLCLLGRAANVFPLTALTNLVAQHADGRTSTVPHATEHAPPLPHRVPVQAQIVLWHAGLRGSIAWALALHFPSQHQVRELPHWAPNGCGRAAPTALRQLGCPWRRHGEPLLGQPSAAGQTVSVCAREQLALLCSSSTLAQGRGMADGGIHFVRVRGVMHSGWCWNARRAWCSSQLACWAAPPRCCCAPWRWTMRPRCSPSRDTTATTTPRLSFCVAHGAVRGSCRIMNTRVRDMPYPRSARVAPRGLKVVQKLGFSKGRWSAARRAPAARGPCVHAVAHGDSGGAKRREVREG
jgi:hypothetical protein